MTRIDGLSLAEAEHAIEDAHPGWQVGHSPGGWEYATRGTVTLWAPSVERIEEPIAVWEHAHPGVIA